MKVFHRYVYDLKLRFKLILSYLGLILIPMAVIFGFFQVRFISRLQETTLDMESVIARQMAGNVESYMNQVESAADAAAQSETLQTLLTYSDTLLDSALANQRQRDAITTCLDNVLAQIDGEVVENIRIYCDGSHPLFSRKLLKDYGVFESIDKIQTSLWYGELQADSRNDLVASPFYMNSWEGEEAGWISYVKRVQYYEDGEKKDAYVAVYFNQSYLSEVLSDYGGSVGSCVYLLDEKDTIVAVNQAEDTNLYILSYADIGELVETEEEFTKIDYGDQYAWTSYLGIGRTGWRMVLVIPEDSVTKAVKTDRTIFMCVYAVIAVLLGVLVLLLSDSITRWILALKKKMQAVKNGPPEALLTPHSGDEIGELTDSYNYMAGKINELLAERVGYVREINRMEMSALRAQINPHFLYNTLDMISWYAKKGETEEAIGSIQSLARFYKLSLNHGKLITTVENEVRLLEQYVGLQCRRVQGEIELIVDIPEEMLEKQILQFLLQPIVENSLKHGILEKEDARGYIMLTGWLEEKEMVLLIADDGVGMDPAAAAALPETAQGNSRDGEGHIGVRNIYRRLEVFYGKGAFSMKYSSTPGEGTQVELRLPYEIREEAYKNV